MKELCKIQSICPVCHKLLKAAYIMDDKQVLLVKTCPEHGEFTSVVADDPERFMEWVQNPMLNIPPKKPLTKGFSSLKPEDRIGADDFDSQCPFHCGLCQDHLQAACCVLIDVTERCNQHCPYCFAKAEDACEDEPDLEAIGRKYDLLLSLGEERPFNIQVSGGEPTVRDDLPEIIKLGRDKGFVYIQINTNGRRIALEEGYANRLKEAGASVIYLQFDGTNDEIYQAIRGEPLIELKQKAIENCRKARLPVTLVPTIVKNVNLANIGSMFEFLLANLDVVKGIHFQPVSFFGRHPERMKGGDGKYRDYENRVTLFDVMGEIQEQTGGEIRFTDFYPIRGGHPLCSFRGTFRRMQDGSVQCLEPGNAAEEGDRCCNCSKQLDPAAQLAPTVQSDPSVQLDASTQLELIRRDRDFVRNKWSLPDPEFLQPEGPQSFITGESCLEADVMDFDYFLADMKNNLFTVTGMAFQDSSNLDAERLKRCRVHVLSKEDRIIPFCAYNSIYRT